MITFKKIITRILAFWITIGFIMGTFSLFGVIPVSLNGKETYGIKGFIVALSGTSGAAISLSIAFYFFMKMGDFIIIFINRIHKLITPKNNNRID